MPFTNGEQSMQDIIRDVQEVLKINILFMRK